MYSAGERGAWMMRPSARTRETTNEESPWSSSSRRALTEKQGRPPGPFGPATPIAFTLRNTGDAAGLDAGAHFAFDLFRLSVSVEGRGWTARLLNGLAAVEAGASGIVTVFVSCAPDAAPSATITLRAASESDPAQSAIATIETTR